MPFSGIMSGFSSTSERISSAWASMRPDLRSPPSGFGLKSPFAAAVYDAT